eukprot:6185073-Pleurochrysis_carterae.AAC.1
MSCEYGNDSFSIPLLLSYLPNCLHKLFASTPDTTKFSREDPKAPPRQLPAQVSSVAAPATRARPPGVGASRSCRRGSWLPSQPPAHGDDIAAARQPHTGGHAREQVCA